MKTKEQNSTKPPVEVASATHLEADLMADETERLNAVRPVKASWLTTLPAVTKVEAVWQGAQSSHLRDAIQTRADKMASAIAEVLEEKVAVEHIDISLGASPIAGISFPVTWSKGAGHALARACPFLASGLLQAVTGTASAPLANRPDPVSAAVLGHAALLVCKAMNDEEMDGPRLLTAQTKIPRTSMTLELGVRLGEIKGHAQIDLDEHAALSLARHLSAVATEARALGAADDAHGNGSDLARLPVNARLCMGPVRLTTQAVRDLGPGDAICPSPDAQLVNGMPSGPAFLSASSKTGLAAIGNLEGDQLRVDSLGHPRHTSEEVTMSDAMKPACSLEVDAHLVLASLPMTFEELSSLGPGSVLELPNVLPRVRVQVGEQTVAVGELVNVEGVLGVRIVEGGL